MCGILCHISGANHIELGSYEFDLLSRRGPDSLKTHNVTVNAPTRSWFLTLTSSVLALRGCQVQEQPIVDEVTGSVFCWNGEVWRLDGAVVKGNDALLLSERFFQATKYDTQADEYVLKTLGSVAGPFAFVFYNAVSSKLYFGRDVLGRRSLLIQDSALKNGELTISSVSGNGDHSHIREVSAPYIYSINMALPELIVETHKPIVQPPRVNRLCPTSSFVLNSTPSSKSITALIGALEESIRLRVEAVPTYTEQQQKCSNPSRVAILFSGGLDCTLLTRLTHNVLPLSQTVDLLNVAFENPRVIRARGDNPTGNVIERSEPYESCPDRVTGRSSFRELKECCPERQWRFVAINVPYHEYSAHRDTIIRLNYPHNTEMDLSITAALYFAAKGHGSAVHSDSSPSPQQYTTTARVLLSGFGADEMFGGYARHAAAFSRGGYASLIEELDLDFSRIGSRNLGRDDRVIAHWARETRYPFLDENFVEFALGLPVWEKCGFRCEKSVLKHFEVAFAPQKMEDLYPEKMLLRCALWQLGLKIAAAEKKRAIQFGSRTAKMHRGRVKGTDLVTTHDDPPSNS